MGVKSYDISAQHAGSGLVFANSGTKLYGFNATTIFQYTLSVAWNITTITYDSKSFNASGQASTIRDICISTNGTKLYVMGVKGELQDIYVWQYTLSTPFDISTASYNSIEKLMYILGISCFINSVGTRLFLIDTLYDIAISYTFGTPWDLSTITKDTTVGVTDTYDFTSIVGTYIKGMTMKPDLSKIYVVNEATTRMAYQFAMSTPGYLPSTSYENKSLNVTKEFTLSPLTLNPNDLAFSSDGYTFYVSQADYIFSYTLRIAWDISSYVPDMTDAPTVETVDELCEDRQATTLTAVGKILTTGGYYTFRGFEFYEDGADDEYDESMYAVREMGIFIETGEFRMTLSGLKPSTVYHIIAFAGNVLGIDYGEWILCSTLGITTPDYGIHEEEPTTPTICFYVSEDGGHTWSLKFGPYTTDQADIAITKILVRGVGKKQIKFTTDALTGLSASVMCKVDVKI